MKLLANSTRANLMGKLCIEMYLALAWWYGLAEWFDNAL